MCIRDSYKTENSDQEHAATHWGDHSNWHDYNLRALKRVHTLLGSLNNAPASIRYLNDEHGKLKPFGLGRKRSLHMYQQWAGIDFTKAEISQAARDAEFKPKKD